MDKIKVAIVGCGRLGQQYATAYSTYPDTELVAIAEYNPERRTAVGERFGVKALYPDAESMLKEIVPDIAAVVTPTKWMKQSVIACAEAGVKGVSTDKPLAAKLSDADEMVEACESRGVIFAGGNLAVAHNHVQETAEWVREGKFGEVKGGIVNCMGADLTGGGVQWISALRLFMNSEISNVIAWGKPKEAIYRNDSVMESNGLFEMSNGISVPFYQENIIDVYKEKFRIDKGQVHKAKMGMDLWTDDSLIRWFWEDLDIYRGFDKQGKRKLYNPTFSDWDWKQFNYLTGSTRSLIKSIQTGSRLAISGHDLRQALEVAIAVKLSARLGNISITLPLSDRSHSLIPVQARWFGGDLVGNPQTVQEARSNWDGYYK